VGPESILSEAMQHFQFSYQSTENSERLTRTSVSLIDVACW